jgi:hypothetical protein
MTADELKSRIRFERREVGVGLLIVTATLELSATMEIDRRCLDGYSDSHRVLNEIEDKLRETLIRRIYEDQRHDLYDALMDLFKVSPMDFTALSAARERALKAARMQRPNTKVRDAAP